MQWINLVVINPWFLATFFGTAVACVITMIRLVVRWHVPGAPCLLAGSVFYLVGTVLVTMLFNVPRNNALAVLEPASAEAEEFWVSRTGSAGQPGIMCEP